MKIEKEGIKASDIALVIIGSIIYALSVSLFLEPFKIVTGGFSGLAITFSSFYNISLGFLIILMNIPLFLYSYFKFGANFVKLTIFATIFSSIFIDITLFLPSGTDNVILAALFGGALMGAGDGMIIAAGGSAGGTDVIGKAAKMHLSEKQYKWTFILLDVIIAVFSALMYGDFSRAAFSALAICTAEVVTPYTL